MFSLLKVDDNFDENTVQKLKDLVIKGDFQNDKIVYKALREAGEGS